MPPIRHDGEGPPRPSVWAGLTLLLAFALLVAGRLGLPLLEPEESLYAVVPRDMLAAGEFVAPTLRGEPYLDKPPLLYWAVMGCYRAFGERVWSARLVPALAAWLTVVVFFLWGRACGGWAVGVACAGVLTLTGDFVYRAPMLTPNGLLGLFTTAGLAAGHLAVLCGRLAVGWWAASAVATGFAVLVKGPVALVLVAGPLLVLPRLLDGLARPGWWAWATYLVVAGVVAAPWYLAVSARHPEFPEYFFWRHHVQRFTNPFDHAKPVYFYLPQMLLGGFPWAAVPFAAACLSFTSGPRPTPLGPDGRFVLLAAAGGALFFSLSGSKRAVYLVPLWPPFAVGVGTLLAPLLAGTGQTVLGVSKRGWLWGGGAVSAALALGVAFWLPPYHRQFSLAEAAEVVASQELGSPVYADLRSRDSLAFLSRVDVVGLSPESALPGLAERLRSSPLAIFVVQNGPPREAFLAALPGDLALDERATGRRVTVVFVRRRTSVGYRIPPAQPRRRYETIRFSSSTQTAQCEPPARADNIGQGEAALGRSQPVCETDD